MKQAQLISSVDEMTALRKKYESNQTIGFVPTMGALHEGHLSLVKKARAENDIVIVSIFVNPTQFGKDEDLTKYPRNLDHDRKLLEELGVSIIFTPTEKEMYPSDFITYVEPTGPIAEEAEGVQRPGHFRGVATIVASLFHIVKPDRAYFGQKDAQQALVIWQMSKDLHFPAELHILPTIRESDGLAMSSRNTYLSQEDRKKAGRLYQALQLGKQTYEKGEVSAEKLIDAMKLFIETDTAMKIDYIECRHAETFAKLTKLAPPALLLIAARIGKTRLIDNFVLETDGWKTGEIQ